MSCRYARETDEHHGWECSETECECMFLVPDEERCYEKYGEGPLAIENVGIED